MCSISVKDRDSMSLHVVMSGKLELICGNMFSGKTTELMRRIRRESSINRRCVVVSYIDDNRYTNESRISTHNGDGVRCLKVRFLSELSAETLEGYDTFFIDEGQFFADLYDSVKYMVEDCNKHIIVAGLDGDYKRGMFGDILRLVPLCDTIDKLTAYCNICNNGNAAPFTKKLDVCTAHDDGSSVIDIGTKDKYIPVCRYHYSFSQ